MKFDFKRDDAPEMQAFKAYLTTLKPLEAMRIVSEVTEFAYGTCMDKAATEAIAALSDSTNPDGQKAAAKTVVDLLQQSGGSAKITTVAHTTDPMEVE